MIVRKPQLASHVRRGSLLPGVAVAILVCGGCLALVLNEYWLTNAQEELRTATQTVALAAAHELASDELLKLDRDPLSLAEQARLKAGEQAIRNQVSGRSLPNMEVHVGRTVLDPATGQQQTLETDYSPNAVVVIGHRDRSRNNPVVLLAPALTGRSVADVTVTAEASITNLIEGLRAFGAVDVPAWPLAILESSQDSRVQTWVGQIEQRRGIDHYSWNAETQTVESTPDGLPEILLEPNGQQGTNNLYLVNIGNDLQDEAIDRQIREGWSATDLSTFGETFSLKPGPLDLAASSNFNGIPVEALKSQIGQMRIMLLYSLVTSKNNNFSVHVTRMVGGRLMRVTEGTNGPQLTMQAAVVITRTAVLDEDALYRGETFGNPYIYKVSITQ